MLIKGLQELPWLKWPIQGNKVKKITSHWWIDNWSTLNKLKKCYFTKEVWVTLGKKILLWLNSSTTPMQVTNFKGRPHIFLTFHLHFSRCDNFAKIQNLWLATKTLSTPFEQSMILFDLVKLNYLKKIKGSNNTYQYIYIVFLHMTTF